MLFDKAGAAVGLSQREYPAVRPEEGWMEQDGDVIFDAVSTVRMWLCGSLVARPFGEVCRPAHCCRHTSFPDSVRLTSTVACLPSCSRPHPPPATRFLPHRWRWRDPVPCRELYRGVVGGFGGAGGAVRHHVAGPCRRRHHKPAGDNAAVGPGHWQAVQQRDRVGGHPDGGVLCTLGGGSPVRRGPFPGQDRPRHQLVLLRCELRVVLMVVVFVRRGSA